MGVYTIVEVKSGKGSIRETVRIDRKDAAELHLGVLSTYSGDEFNRAIAAFTEKYPAVEISVLSGNHEDLYDALRFGKADIVLNDQRRAFSDEYENLILTETVCYVEMATQNSGKLAVKEEGIHAKRCNDSNRRRTDQHGDCPPCGFREKDCPRR